MPTSIPVFLYIECCSILCILSTVCYNIPGDNKTRAFSPAPLTKNSEKNWFFQILSLYLGMSMLSVFVIYLGYMCLFLLILLLIRLFDLHFLALHIPKTKSEIFPHVKWISCTGIGGNFVHLCPRIHPRAIHEMMNIYFLEANICTYFCRIPTPAQMFGCPFYTVLAKKCLLLMVSSFN
jgi:hypothetical protein